jgi:hypothetical protein
MALVPKISLTFGNKCNKVSATDNTLPYQTITNPTGWGTPNINTSNITEALVQIYDSTATNLLETYNVTSVYPGVAGAPTPGNFILINEEPWNLADGIYLVRYKISDGVNNYWAETQHELFTCNLCNCIQNIISKLLKACSTPEVEKLKTQVDQLEIFLYGIKSAFSCGDFDTAENILDAASKYCKTLSDCGCGCGGC